MAILDLKTNLKSLKYESRNEPFVTKDINNPPSNSGIVSQITRRADDVVRVTKAILPANSRFLQNQALLQQIDISKKIDGIKVAQKKTTAGAIVQQVKNTVVSTAKIAASTIAQTAAAGTGLHIVRGFESADKKLYSPQALAEGKITFPKYSPSTELQGIEDYSLVNTNNDKNTYTERSNTAVPGVTANAENKITPAVNAPTKAGNEVIENGTVNLQNYNPATSLSGSYSGKTITEDYGKSNNPYNIKNAYNITDQDAGKETYSTAILTASESNGQLSLVPSQLSQENINFNNPNSRLNKPTPLKVQINFRDTAKNSFSVDPDTGKPVLSTPLDLPIRDFRQGRTDVISFDYNSPTINKEQRVGLGNKGYWKKPIDYTEPVQQSVIDRLNATDVSLNQLNGVGVGASSVRDLVKFRFEVIAPGQTPRFLYFRALLENLDDSYTGRWADTNYVGRGDAVRTYEGFNRDVSLSFKIVATTRDEMKPLYKKMAYLASTTAPTYGEGGSFMKGTLVRLTVGSYLYEVAGTMNNVKYNWKENYPWEIAMQNPDLNIDDDQQELPQMMDCSINFTPIHDFVPQTGLYHYITSPRLSGGAKPFFLSGAQS
jgi:hypothetical protein